MNKECKVGLIFSNQSGNMNEINGLYQYQYPGCDIVL